MKRSQALDVLRGIAILMVLVHHYVPDQFKPGLLWSGVDLFFVLSGFLIASILLENVEARNYYQTFYLRRAARIIPLFWLLLLLFVFLMKFAPEFLGSSYSQHLPLWSYFTFIQNFLYAARGFWRDPFLDVTWSLALEEQFYVFLSVAAKNLNRKLLAGLSIFLIFLAPFLRWMTPDSLAANILPLHRADSLMLGVLIAVLWEGGRGRDRFARFKRHFLVALLPLLAGVAYFLRAGTGFGGPWVHVNLALLYGDLLVLALLHPAAKPHLLFSNKFLEWLGLRSYGIYLLHKPLRLAIVPVLRGLPFIHLAWINLPVTALLLFVVAEISYRLLEKPVMDWGHRFKYDKSPRLAEASRDASIPPSR